MRVHLQSPATRCQHGTAWQSQLLHIVHGRRGNVCGSAGSRRRNPDAPIVSEEFEVPQVGWMWDSGKAAATRTSLKAANIKAKKSLGQNFCTDDSILADIVAAARVAASDAVIEVGPGTGNLTRHLLATQARVLAVEKDDTLVERLRQEFAQAGNLQLVHGDVMRLDLPRLVADLASPAAAAAAASTAADGGPTQQQQLQLQASPDPAAAAGHTGEPEPAAVAGAKPAARRVKVVANLPYNITKEFLLALLPQAGCLSELSIMIQQEVAERLVDPTPNRPDYRAMSVITHFYSRPVYRFRIPKEKYFPVPGVDGALVTFKLLPPSKRLAVPGERGFISLVNKAFSERRKMLRNTLQPLYSAKQVEAALVAAGIRPDARAQELTVAQFAALHNLLHQAVLAAAALTTQQEPTP